MGDEYIQTRRSEDALPKNNTQCGNTTNKGANNSNVPEIIPNTKCLELLISKVPKHNVNIYHNDRGIQADKHDWEVITQSEFDSNKSPVVCGDQQHIPHGENTKGGGIRVPLAGNREAGDNIENHLKNTRHNTDSVPKRPQDPVGDQIERKERGLARPEPVVTPCHGLIPPVGKQQRGGVDDKVR